MPDRPYIAPQIFKESGAMLDVFPDKYDEDVEIALNAKQMDIQDAMVCLTGVIQ